MGVRLRAMAIVALLVAIMGGLPGIAGAAEQETVTVAIHDLEPFVMTDGDIETGFTIELMEAVADRLAWNLEYVTVDNVAEQLKAVADGQVDAGATAISITADRTKDYDFSQPVLAAGLQIMVPTSQLEMSTPGLRDFLKLLFSKTMVVWLAAGLIISVIPAHIIWFSERRHTEPMVSSSYFPGIFDSFSWSVSMLAGQPENIPRHVFTRALAVVWAFVGIIFVAYYTATLTANLTVSRFDAAIKTPADLIGKRVCTVTETTAAAYLTDLGVRPREVGAIDDCYAELKKGKLDAVVFDSPVLRYFVAHEGAGVAQIVGTIFEPDNYGVVFPLGTKLRKEFNRGFLSIREEGTYALIKQKWFGFETATAGASG